MGFKSWFFNLLGEAKNPQTGETISYSTETTEDNINPHLLAIATCINLIAKTVANCEFKIMSKGVPQKNSEYYLWNVRPNKNQSASEFMQKLVSKYYTDPNGVLIVQINNELLIADSFSEKQYELYDNQYTQVTVGNITLKDTFFESKVMRLRNPNQKALSYVSGVYDDFAKMLTGAKEAFYMQGGEHGTLNISAVAQKSEKFQDNYEKIVNRMFKRYAKNRNAALPLFEGYSYTKDTTNYAGSAKSDDYGKLLNQYFDVAAKTFAIPPKMITGEVADTSKARADFLSFCIDPLLMQIEQEGNAKRFTKTQYLEGTKIKVDSSACLHIDLIDNASSIDKLIASGVFSINDVLTILSLPTVKEKWADEHYITKNYEKVKGGENSVQNNSASN